MRRQPYLESLAVNHLHAREFRVYERMYITIAFLIFTFNQSARSTLDARSRFLSNTVRTRSN
jgi:hypothetical protein